MKYAARNLEGHPQTPRTRRPLFRTLFMLIVAVQLAFLLRVLNTLVSRNSNNPRYLTSNANSDPADDWKDDVWPIRQPSAWDISTDFPYPRVIEYDVDEGTWLRLDVHPTSGEIVFDMLGDLYCLPADAHLQAESVAHPILLGVPHDSDPHFSPDGKKLVYRSDAELGVENIWVTAWSGCANMDLRPAGGAGLELGVELAEALAVKKAEEDMLATGIKETSARTRRRLVREGRFAALRVTNETYRWITDARFHPSGASVVATKWYTSSRSIGAGEGWEYPIPLTNDSIGIGSGRRLVGRTLPLGWRKEKYGDEQVGPEQFIWRGEDSLIYAMNVVDVDGAYTYSKDVHSGIYAIFSRNLTTNSTETLVGASPGGASRPELSRDGRTLAFVRRVRDKEALVLKDLETGTLNHVWHGLTYDLTTISAPMGTYPSFAFTPADDAVIIWSAGKIWRVPLSVNGRGEKVALGTPPEVIRFTAHVEKQIAETVMGETDLIGLETRDEQRLWAFKEMSVDEEGGRVVFQGAGATYYLDVSSAALSPAQKENTAQRVPVLHSFGPYYSPSIVPGTNSSLIVHAHWSDTNFTSFELANVSSNTAYAITGLPMGRYRAPVLCECTGQERTIAFVKTGGDVLTANVVATAGAGLYIADITLPSSSSVYDTFNHVEMRPETIAIRNLRFIPSQINPSIRLTLRFFSGNSKLLVQQYSQAFVIDLAGGPDALGTYNHTTIAEGLMSMEIVPSLRLEEEPKADRIAFVDFFNVYVVNAKNVRGPVWSKPGSSPEGLARTGVDGGHDVQWSRDGKRLFWLLGPYLHSLDVSLLSRCQSEIKNDASTYGISCVKDLLDVQEIHISYPTDVWRLKQDSHTAAIASGNNAAIQYANSDVLAITNATVLTMESGRLHEDFMGDAVVIVRAGLIESVGHADKVVVPQGATVINAHRGFVVPGLIDMHAHWGGMTSIYPARSWELETFLAYGVTTLHNPSSDNVDGFVERARVENGGMAGPRIFHTGSVIYGAGAPGIHQDIVDMAEARSALTRIKAEGGPASFSYKNYNQYSRASRQRLLLAARNLTMLCVPEGGMNQDWDLTYIVDGMTTIEHALPIPTLYDDVLKLYAISGTGSSPTHIVNYGGAWGEQLVWAHEDVPNDAKLRRFTRHDILEGLTESTARPKNSYALFNTSTSVAKMVKQGLRAHIGAHGEPPLGLNYHAEMYFTQQGGLDSYEVLRAATIDAAITLGLNTSLGSLSTGKLADFIVYPPGFDLLKDDIRKSRNIKYVARGGRVWDAETMVEEWPKKGRRPLMPPINAE